MPCKRSPFAIDFPTVPWTEASLITPQHAIQALWNEATMRKSCAEPKRQHSVDVCVTRNKGEPLSLAQHYALANGHKTDERRKGEYLTEFPLQLA